MDDDDDKFGASTKEIFEKIDTIGSGTYGVVYKGKNKETGETIAIKKIKIDLENEGVPSTALREITILRELIHPNIVQLKDVVCEENKWYLLFEYLDYDLKKYMDDKMNTYYNGSNTQTGNIEIKGGWDEETIKSFLFQILDGVTYCHAKKIIHRDLKPQNLLIDKHGKLKIADFGLARTFSIPVRSYTKEVLTLWYRSPEILLGCSEYSTPVDIWSIGCIFAELYLGKPIFEGENEIDELNKIFEIWGTPTKEIWPNWVNMPEYKDNFPIYQEKKLDEVIMCNDPKVISLIKSMLQYDPSKRITAKQALLHPYFSPDKKYTKKK